MVVTDTYDWQRVDQHTVSSGKPCHWTCALAWVNACQDQADTMPEGRRAT
jgi:hypothetical protein